ncbi:hypothetical protein HPB48_019433 [Haemaphysalis longicornis]|uniref:CCHC-type domain-containing protein n=1 Tax=Haemaphysalis longicornis TaxID=44386 RepID=A0A9J6FER0_HAELO|nr:hypothetical protein HPB48_019433 [Haemaphysalis longicornis]
MNPFSENWYGTAFKAYLGPERAESLTVLPSREQNLIVIHTPDPDTADKVIGDFAVNIERRQVLLRGYLREDGGNVCHGVIVVRNTDTTETLRESVRWRLGTIVEKKPPRFVHYDTMLIPVQPYYRTIPACGKCGVVRHRMDACPNPRPDTCGLCGQQVQLVEEGVRAPHDCVPVCSVCGGAHATNSRACTAKHRISNAAASNGRKSRMAAKKRRQPQTRDEPGEPPRRDNVKTNKQAPTTGAVGKQPTVQSCSGGGQAWANAVKNGKQVSGTGGAASSSPLEAMESETGAAAKDALAALEARMSALEARMDSVITGLQNQISTLVEAAIGKMTEAIATLIVQQVARSNKQTGLIKDVFPWPTGEGI